MKSQFSLFIFIMIVALGSHQASAQAFWTLTTDGQKTAIKSGNSYYLKVTKSGDGNGYHLKYKKRSTGINLSWGKEASPNIRIEKQGGGTIKCGDKVAIHVKNGGYIKYEQRKWGINIVWSTPAVYEWEIRSLDNKVGSTLNTDVRVGLYNTKNQQFMVYCNRVGSNTVNLAWFGDCHGGIRLPGALNDITKEEIISLGKYLLPLVL